MSRICLCFLLVVPALLASGCGSRKTATGPSVYLPGGVADAAGRTGFVTGPDGRIDAINLEDGKLLWKTKEAAHPLALHNGRLAASIPVSNKANCLRVLLFDTTQEGKRVLESEVVVFPDWVSVGLEYGRSFEVTAAETVKDDLLMHWEARAIYVGGHPPSRVEEERRRKHATGIARVNLKTGKADIGRVNQTTGKAAMPALGLSRAEAEVPAAIQKETSGRFIFVRPRVVGKLVVALDQQGVPGQRQKLVLLRWDRKTGKKLPQIVLMKAHDFWVYIQPDGRYILVYPRPWDDGAATRPGGRTIVARKVPTQAELGPGRVFSLETGKEVGKVLDDPGGEAIAVVGPRVFFLVLASRIRQSQVGSFTREQLRTLRAYDLESGQMLWERPVEPIRRLPPLR
jgi:hypothetical protein